MTSRLVPMEPEKRMPQKNKRQKKEKNNTCRSKGRSNASCHGGVREKRRRGEHDAKVTSHPWSMHGCLLASLFLYRAWMAACEHGRASVQRRKWAMISFQTELDDG